jgi:hypothetical protein
MMFMSISFCFSSKIVERGGAKLDWYVTAKPPARQSAGDGIKWCSRDTPRVGGSCSWESSLTAGLAVLFLLGDPCESPWFAVVRSCWWQVMVVLRWVRWGRLVDFGGVDDGGILLVAANIIYGEVAFGAFLLLVLVKIWVVDLPRSILLPLLI